ncbi:MAG TPA: MBL fold metallo-hydrolase [Solirubrobacteraceae bacterium]|nr:MBL fold metallo-hydrolase [Solirubrobacteraceae bacterium]
MRAIGVHEDVIVLESRVWRTTCTLIRDGSGEAGEGFVIDSPVLPDELELLPAVLEQSGFPCSGLLATHADWDHLLGRLAFPGAPLGVAETTAARLRGEPGAAQRELRDFDERFYLSRQAPLSLGSVEALAVPGYCGLGEKELELHPAGGHTVDGMAVWAPWLGLLVCGDYLSPVEIPTPAAGIDLYLDTLTRLEPLVAAASHIVPGHGGLIDRETAQRVLVEDRAYLEALRRDGDAAALPDGRRDSEQRRLHAENGARLV